MTVSAIGIPPFLVYFTNGSIGGTEILLLRSLAQHFEFHLSVEIQDRWYDTIKDDDGAITGYLGTVGDVYHERAHFGIACHYIYLLTWPLIDFLETYSYGTHYKSVRPRPLPPYLNLLKPFALDTWIMTTSILAGTMIGFAFFAYISGFNRHDLVKSSMHVYMHQFSQSKF